MTSGNGAKTDLTALDARITTVSDWLHLHGVTAAALAAWLPTANPTPQPPDPPLPAPAAPEMVALALAQALPQLTPLLERLKAEVRFDLAPDTRRFPRAFTIDNPGDCRPFISCPCTGRTSDLLMLAHEIGHALQALAGPATTLPPIQRELAAFITEDAAARGLLAAHPATGPLLATRRARVTRHGPGLRAALAAPGTTYRYAWNYPVARAMASCAAATLPPDDLAALITAPGTLGPLLARLALRCSPTPAQVG